MYLSENRLSRNEMWCTVDTVLTIVLYSIYEKGFLDSNFIMCTGF